MTKVVLDPNPSKALTELVTGGGITVPTAYSAMDAQSKLGFGTAQCASSSIAISDFSPSSEVTDLLDLSLDDEQRLNS